MPSPLEEAFEMMLDSREEATGIREKVSFRGGELDFLCQTEIIDYSPGAGGTDYTPTLTISLRKSDVVLPIRALGEEVDDEDPEDVVPEEVIVRGKTLAILSYAPLEGRIDLTLGTATDEMNNN